MALIGLLEDEPDLREELQAYLVSIGHRVVAADSVAAFLAAGADLRFDLVVLDRGLPDADGLEVAERLRRAWPQIGIVMLTARGASQDRVHGLEKGADHYLVKPLHLSELGAHVSALLRRIPRGWRLEARASCLYTPDDVRLDLSGREFALLRLLAERQGEVAGRREVAEALGWEWMAFDQRRLDTMISRLRRRCRDICGLELPIRTEHARGYHATETIGVE
ncbi:response regulator transcription factor [Pseudoxanthomonas winnipegensis]|uniref:response regulator transcription factor n=1 Tax=Pseudoxanthomonas winnipegensis TaxID=2480810 RepID=UPI002575B219|nr:response regulator transcription factor [Pseudoxanthomonas winnipegensis]WJI16125.1 response regulator transcription factor [Pseudoxanthomonas winnipegensis]